MRTVLFAVAGFLVVGLAFGADAQTGAKVYRVGMLATSAGPGQLAIKDGLSRELVQRGFVPGRTLVIELRSAEGQVDRLSELAKGLVDGGANVIVTTGYPAARAAKDVVTTVPVIVVNAGDPVETGLDRVTSIDDNDRDRGHHIFSGARRRITGRDDHIGAAIDQSFGQFGEPIDLALR